MISFAAPSLSPGPPFLHRSVWAPRGDQGAAGDHQWGLPTPGHCADHWNQWPRPWGDQVTAPCPSSCHTFSSWSPSRPASTPCSSSPSCSTYPYPHHYHLPAPGHLLAAASCQGPPDPLCPPPALAHLRHPQTHLLTSPQPPEPQAIAGGDWSPVPSVQSLPPWP